MSLENQFEGEKKDNGRDTAVIERPKPHTPEYDEANRIHPTGLGISETATGAIQDMSERMSTPCLFSKMPNTVNDDPCVNCQPRGTTLTCDGYIPNKDYEKSQ